MPSVSTADQSERLIIQNIIELFYGRNFCRVADKKIRDVLRRTPRRYFPANLDIWFRIPRIGLLVMVYRFSARWKGQQAIFGLEKGNESSD